MDSWDWRDLRELRKEGVVERDLEGGKTGPRIGQSSVGGGVVWAMVWMARDSVVKMRYFILESGEER